MTYTPAQLTCRHASLVRKVRRAYDKTTEWNRKHHLAMDELAVFLMRFGDQIKREVSKSA